jgi:hypothetical protein
LGSENGAKVVEVGEAIAGTVSERIDVHSGFVASPVAAKIIEKTLTYLVVKPDYKHIISAFSIVYSLVCP